MKILFCLDDEEDLRTIQTGQLQKLVPEEELITPIISKDNPKQDLLDCLSNIEDEYIVFVPIGNVLLEPPNTKEINNVIDKCKNENHDYARLRRVGAAKPTRPIRDNVWHKDEGAILFLVPHVFRTETLKNIINKVRLPQPEMFWLSLETSRHQGIFYYKPSDQGKELKYSYWVPKIFHTISAVLDQNGKWDNSYINFNEKPLQKLFTEYNIDVQQRGSSFEGVCCQ